MFPTIYVPTFTITRPARGKGGNQVIWNVALDGNPFGQIWTFQARGECHPFHAKALSGEYARFRTYKDAELFLRGLI